MLFLLDSHWIPGWMYQLQISIASQPSEFIGGVPDRLCLSFVAYCGANVKENN